MLLIKNGLVKTMSGTNIENGQILIEDGIIKAVGKDLEIPEDADVIDVSGCIVTPGLIDAHCHIGIMEEGIGFEGDDTNEITNPITPHMRAIDGINPICEEFEEAIKGGITTAVVAPGSANIIGGHACAIKTYGKRIDNMIVKNPIGMKIAFGENPKRCYGKNDKTPMTRMAVAALLRENLYKAKNYMDKKEKAKNDPEKMPDFDLKMEALIPVLKKEIPLKAHAHRADDILTAIRIAKEFDLDITLDHCTEGHLIADEIAKEGKCALVGPSLSGKVKYELKNLTFETPKILNEAGIKIAIITDAPVIPVHYLSLCAGLAVKSGLDEEEAWKAITINAAEIININNRVGSIETGKDADIVVFKGNPLTDIDCKTVMTIINGKIVFRMQN